MKKFKKRYGLWKRWRKSNSNSKMHQFLVLIGMVHSPSFENFLANHEIYSKWILNMICGIYGVDDKGITEKKYFK